MRASAKLSIPAFLLIITVLAGCSNEEGPETLAIEHRGEFEGVLVSSAYSTVQTAGYDETFIEGQDKADELIDQLNGKELVKATEAELQERADLLEQTGSYRMMLYNTPGVGNENQHLYSIIFYNDGAIQADQEGATYFLDNPPEDLLAQLKQQWNISF
ncbi:hypothetical protein [Planococcus sp. SSTMD024]|uniref:hypothetical protein n=1 Tax=Planococcus sp. SSTMD024 TaxID=3242163 RepID=UPI00351EB33D